MGYVYFTDEQKERANSVDLVDFLHRQGEKLLPSGRDKRLASDPTVSRFGGIVGMTTPAKRAAVPLTL